MKKRISGNYELSRFATLIVFCVLIIIIASVWYFSDDFDVQSKSSSIVSGLLVGFVLLLFQIFLSKYELTIIDIIEKLGVINIFQNRKDKKRYGELIDESKKEITVLGVTANRMLEDFANETDNSDMQLISALSRGVKVRLMLSKPEFLDDRNRSALETITLPAIERLQAKYSNLELRYYEGKGSHSIFKVDDKCIVGPIFDGVYSKETPSILMKSSSKYVKPYLDYFEKIWAQAE